MHALTSLAASFGVAAGEYEHFSFDAAAAKNATAFIIAACIGIVLAALYNFYQRSVPGSVVRAILRAEALSPEKAKTAEELGLGKKPLCLWELMRGTTLRRVIRFVGDEQGQSELRSAQNGQTRYYIPEQSKYRAELRFDKKGNGVVALVLIALLSAVLAFLLIKLLPWFLSILDSFL
jgi:hypothetical protein